MCCPKCPFDPLEHSGEAVAVPDLQVGSVGLIMHVNALSVAGVTQMVYRSERTSPLESRGEHSTDRKVLHRGSAFRVPVCRGQRDRGKPRFEHQRVGGWNELGNLSMVRNGDLFPLF